MRKAQQLRRRLSKAYRKVDEWRKNPESAPEISENTKRLMCEVMKGEHGPYKQHSLQWSMTMHMNYDTEHLLQETAEYKGITLYRETCTRMNKGGYEAGKSRTIYYVQSSKRNYKTLEALLKSLEAVA